MRTPVLVAAVAIALAVVAGAIGCQTYDFEPVKPLAVAQTTAVPTTIGQLLRPNMVLLVDKSGSMNFAVDYGNPNCPANCGQTAAPACPVCPDPPNGTCCPTRWTDLKAAMRAFLTNSGTVARMGVSFFPGAGGQCNASSTVAVGLPSGDTP